VENILVIGGGMEGGGSGGENVEMIYSFCERERVCGMSVKRVSCSLLSFLILMIIIGGIMGKVWGIDLGKWEICGRGLIWGGFLVNIDRIESLVVFGVCV
jgi:hypothetical protein